MLEEKKVILQKLEEFIDMKKREAHRIKVEKLNQMKRERRDFSPQSSIATKSRTGSKMNIDKRTNSRMADSPKLGNEEEPHFMILEPLTETSKIMECETPTLVTGNQSIDTYG